MEVCSICHDAIEVDTEAYAEPCFHRFHHEVNPSAIVNVSKLLGTVQVKHQPNIRNNIADIAGHFTVHTRECIQS